MSDLNSIIEKQNDKIDSIVSGFISALKKIIDAASDEIALDIKLNLNVENDKIAQTFQNQKLLSNIDVRFQDILNKNGYQKILSEYVDSFNGQFEWFNQILESLSVKLPEPLPPVKFTKQEMSLFELQKISTKNLIETAISSAANTIQRQAIQSVGGLTPKQLSLRIKEASKFSLAESENLADTSIATFYRTITDKGYQIIEGDLPGVKIRYNYEGPLDKLTRAFCTKLERQSRGGRSWTRPEIEKMDNGQIPNVFTTCGGYRCRHQWVISIDELKQKKFKIVKRNPDQRDSIRGEISARRIIHSIGKKVDRPLKSDIETVRQQVKSEISKRRK